MTETLLNRESVFLKVWKNSIIKTVILLLITCSATETHESWAYLMETHNRDGSGFPWCSRAQASVGPRCGAAPDGPSPRWSTRPSCPGPNTRRARSPGAAGPWNWTQSHTHINTLKHTVPRYRWAAWWCHVLLCWFMLCFMLPSCASCSRYRKYEFPR